MITYLVKLFSVKLSESSYWVMTFICILNIIKLILVTLTSNINMKLNFTKKLPY